MLQHFPTMKCLRFISGFGGILRSYNSTLFCTKLSLVVYQYSSLSNKNESGSVSFFVCVCFVPNITCHTTRKGVRSPQQIHLLSSCHPWHPTTSVKPHNNSTIHPSKATPQSTYNYNKKLEAMHTYSRQACSPQGPSLLKYITIIRTYTLPK